MEVSCLHLLVCTVFLQNSVKPGELAWGPEGWSLGPALLPVGTAGAELGPACTTYWSYKRCLLLARARGKLNIQIPLESAQALGLCHSSLSFCICPFFLIGCFSSKGLSGERASAPLAPGVVLHRNPVTLWSLHSPVQSLAGLAAQRVSTH